MGAKTLASAAIVLVVLIAAYWLRSTPVTQANGAQDALPHPGSGVPPKPPAKPSDDAFQAEAIPEALTGAESSPASARRPPTIRTASVASDLSCWRIPISVQPDFTFTLDGTERTNGEYSGSITATRESRRPGILFQAADATPLRGKRVELSADMRTRGATNGAGLWLRGDDGQGNLVAFDYQKLSNDPAPGGDIEWSTHHVVLDIPDDARLVSFGLSLSGSGQVWFDNVRIEVVSLDTPITGESARSPHGLVAGPTDLTNKPGNLDFELPAGAACDQP
jgi:hypothetical protein